MKILLTLTLSAFTAIAAERPNILFLLSDDQDWTGLSVAMHPDNAGSKSTTYQTPNLEKFAAQSMRFSAAYAPSPVCSPTRISLQTGMSSARLQWTKAAPVMTASSGYKLIPPTHRKALRSDETTIAEVLKEAGYATAHYGKWHISGGGPEKNGYDDGDGDNGNEVSSRHKGDNPVDIVGMGSRAAAFMKKSKEDGKPFFIQMSYHALHSPENASPKSIEKFRTLLPDAPERTIQRAAITYDLDQGVGRLLKELDALDLADNTWVVYMSDNGGGGGGSKGRRGGSRSLQGGKGSLWEGGIRVPLIIRGPGVAPNSWSHERVVGYDLFPTFCEIAGVRTTPKNLDGGSILPQLGGATNAVGRPGEGLVFHFPHYQGDTPHSAIYLDDYKLIKFYETGELKLFDIRKDIGESQNLAQQMPELAAKMVRLLDAYLIEVDAQLPKRNPDAIDQKTYDPKSAKGEGRRSRTGKGAGRRGPKRTR